MTQPKTVIVPFHRPVRRRRIDLALALALLGNAVRAHERARVRRVLLRLALPPRSLGRYQDAKPLGT